MATILNFPPTSLFLPAPLEDFCDAFCVAGGAFGRPCTQTMLVVVTDKSVVADIDECAEHSDNCSPMATCMNTEGHFACACPTGYVGDGVTCEGNNAVTTLATKVKSKVK